MPERAAAQRHPWEVVAETKLREANAYRIEADELLRDYDALELDAGIMLAALSKIAEGRRNRIFDPWARKVARDALVEVSDRVTAMRTQPTFPADHPTLPDVRMESALRELWASFGHPQPCDCATCLTVRKALDG